MRLALAGLLLLCALLQPASGQDYTDYPGLRSRAMWPGRRLTVAARVSVVLGRAAAQRGQLERRCA